MGKAYKQDFGQLLSSIIKEKFTVRNADANNESSMDKERSQLIGLSIETRDNGSLSSDEQPGLETPNSLRSLTIWSLPASCHANRQEQASKTKIQYDCQLQSICLLTIVQFSNRVVMDDAKNRIHKKERALLMMCTK